MIWRTPEPPTIGRMGTTIGIWYISSASLRSRPAGSRSEYWRARSAMRAPIDTMPCATIPGGRDRSSRSVTAGLLYHAGDLPAGIHVNSGRHDEQAEQQREDRKHFLAAGSAVLTRLPVISGGGYLGVVGFAHSPHPRSRGVGPGSVVAQSPQTATLAFAALAARPRSTDPHLC